MSEATPARGGVRLVDQHAHPRDETGPREQSGHQTHLEGRTGAANNHQQQQRLVSWGVLGPADAAQVSVGGAVGHRANSRSEGIMQALQEMHQQPPWAGLTVCSS